MCGVVIGGGVDAAEVFGGWLDGGWEMRKGVPCLQGGGWDGAWGLTGSMMSELDAREVVGVEERFDLGTLI